MNKQYLESMVYKFYPKNLSPIHQKVLYDNSKENILLNSTIENRINFSEKKKLLLINDLTLITSLDFDDFSLFSWRDRAYNIQTVLNKKDNIINVLCINISVLIPFYTMYCLKIIKNPNGISLKTAPFLDREIYTKNSLLISKITHLLDVKYQLNKFNSSLRNQIIKDIGFLDIDLGKFTFFNAFFLNEYNHTRY